MIPLWQNVHPLGGPFFFQGRIDLVQGAQLFSDCILNAASKTNGHLRAGFLLPFFNNQIQLFIKKTFMNIRT
jgi:hypothetical protein